MFKQHAEGTFQVDVGGRFHCGPDHTSPKTLRYKVTVTAPDSCLNEHGFLCDNQCFQQYFDGIGYTEDSCELMAWRAADHFYKMVGHEGCRVEADIQVPGLADIEYEEDSPTYPPEPVHIAVSKYANDRLKGRLG